MEVWTIIKHINICSKMASLAHFHILIANYQTHFLVTLVLYYFYLVLKSFISFSTFMGGTTFMSRLFILI